MTGTGFVVIPANEAPWTDLQTVFGERGEAHRCQCQWFKTPVSEFRALTPEDRAERLRAQTECGYPDADTTTGLLAYLDEEPVGWCALEPRTEYPRLKGSRIPWSGREEDPSDDTVWAITCYVTRTGYRRRGVAKALTAAAVTHARTRGARALEGYPIAPKPGQEFSWGELYVGSRSMFTAAGFRQITRPTERRVVMRIDF
ncbi:MAG TPA: GNAT family N-acetyltransferase [Actinospica sp.]|nr:GNAT family N-acetyltransferase [Actinospica sp.]